MPENLHKLFVISSPSGGGKTSLINKLFEDSRSSNFEKSISDTTRQKRQGDIEGKDYYFLSKKDFEEKIQKEGYIEYATVFENFYGTAKEEIKTKFNNSNLILELDWQGDYSVKSCSKLYSQIIASFNNNKIFIFFNIIADSDIVGNHR